MRGGAAGELAGGAAWSHSALTTELQGFGLEHLKRVTRKDPEPGPGQVVVRMRYASLNFRDQVVVAGGYGSLIRTPLVPCSDPSRFAT